MVVFFNDYIGKETIEKEYKEFTFNLSGMHIDMQLAEKYCYNNSFKFNKDVIKNLKKYLEVYLPKYASSFWNTKIKSGIFYIGVNDYGIIKGIPYNGKISIKELKKNIYNIINKNVLCLNDNNFIFNDYIRIKFIKVNKPNKPKTKINKKFLEYLIEKEKYIKEYNDFLKKLKEWRCKLLSISQKKLVDLVNTNNTRQKIIRYIYNHDKKSKIIDLLKSDFKLEYKNHEEISVLKNDINNIYYWITQWKDNTREKIRRQKPIFYNNFNQHNLPINIITSVSDMIPYWYYNNKNMNIYLIKIEFKLIEKNYNFGYFDINNRFLLTQRVIYNNSPACMPQCFK